MLGRVTCREATRLLSASRERPLGLGESFVLRFHLVACDMCLNFNKQLDFLAKASGKFRSGND